MNAQAAIRIEKWNYVLGGVMSLVVNVIASLLPRSSLLYIGSDP